MSTEIILAVLGVALPGLGVIMWWMYRRLWSTNDKDHEEMKSNIKDVEKEGDEGRRVIHKRIETLSAHVTNECVSKELHGQAMETVGQAVEHVDERLDMLRDDFRAFGTRVNQKFDTLGKGVENKFDTLNQTLIDTIKEQKSNPS